MLKVGEDCNLTLNLQMFFNIYSFLVMVVNNNS